ncbi:MAG: hypothetical protein GYA24_24645 [Candidatus Lokiarchaeota archaeon]|nr:hypothetical protein [Candidatus Lokiarchaeota archaeon]
MRGMSISSLALAAFATAIAIMGMGTSIGLGVLCTAAVMDGLQIPLGIKDIEIGAGFIKAKRPKNGSPALK